MLLLIAGPYRGGTNDDPTLIKRNLDALERAAYEVYQLGHTPMVGEWLALPLMRAAGSQGVGDAVYERMSYPIAHRMLLNCDGVLRIPGASKGADQDLEVAHAAGIEVYHALSEIPAADA